jgi:hypothetical protein
MAAEAAAPMPAAAPAAEGQFYYADDAGVKRGPVDVAAIRALLRDGDVDGLTLVWSPAMGPDWKPLGEVPQLKAALQAAAADYDEGEEDNDGDADDSDVGMNGAAAAAPAAASSSSSAAATAAASTGERQFYYADSDGTQRGPITATSAASLAAAGYLAPATLVWGPPMATWEPLSAVPELAAAVAAAGGGGSSSSSSASNSSAGAAAAAAAAATTADGAPADGGGGGTKRKRERTKKGGGGAGGWKSAKTNPWVYVTGLPPDATEDELAAHFRKAGLIKLDPATEKPRVKLYRCVRVVAGWAGRCEPASR